MSFYSVQVHGLFAPQEVVEMLARLKQMAAQQWSEDVDVPGAFARLRPLDDYLEPLACEIPRLVGFEVVPVRTYARIYVAGSVLRPHVDKEDIPYGVSVCLSRGAEDWPFKVGEQQYVDRVGSGVVYDGSVRHYRRGKCPGEQAQVFFHYARKV